MNIGFATMQVIPSLRGVEGEVQRQLGGSLDRAGARAGASSGRSFGSRFGSAVSGVVRGVGRTIETGLTGAATAVGIGFGAALSKGFQRVTAIQDATAALTISLGSSAEAGQLLGDVLDVIRGTPFNLDQFATAAQRLAGMGIEARKIPHFLEAIGEASATQGRRSGEFVERLVRVFGQVQAQGRIMGQDILQMSETGVNALAILGNAYGKTTEEMRDMISRGAVPAQEALDIIADGILNGSDGVAGATVALGGTMASLRQTLTGSIGGLGAAAARFGAAFITPLTPLLTKAFQAGATVLDAFEEKVSAFGTTIEGRFPIFDRLFDFLADAPDRVGPLADRIAELAPAFAPLIAAIAGLAASNLARSLGPLGLLIPSLGPLGGLIAGLVAVSPELRDVLIEIAQAAAPLVGDIISGLQPALAALGPVVTAIASAIGELLLGALEGVAPIVPGLVEVVTVLGLALADMLPSVVAVALALLDAFLPAVEAMLPVIVALAPVLAALAASVADFVAATPPGVIQAIAGAFLAFKGAQAGVSAVKSLHARVTNVVGAVGKGRDALRGFFSTGAGGGKLKSGLQAVGRAASGTVSGIRNAVTALASYARTAALAAASALRAGAAWVAQKVAMIASTAATYAMTAAQAALNFVMSLNPIVLVVLAIAGLVAALVLAYNHVGWFRDAVDAGFRVVLGAVQGVFNWIKSNWPLLLAILTGPIGLAVLGIVRHWDKIKNGITSVKDFIKQKIDQVVGFFRGLPGRISTVTLNMFGGIKSAFKSAVNTIIGWWNGLSFTIGGGTYDPLGRFGPSVTVPAFTFSTPNLPTLHTGGIFRAPGGDREGLALLEDGEGVFTRDQMNALGSMVGQGGRTVIRIDGNGLDRSLLEWLRRAVRAQGGDVQIVLGTP